MQRFELEIRTLFQCFVTKCFVVGNKHIQHTFTRYYVLKDQDLAGYQQRGSHILIPCTCDTRQIPSEHWQLHTPVRVIEGPGTAAALLTYLREAARVDAELAPAVDQQDRAD